MSKIDSFHDFCIAVHEDEVGVVARTLCCLLQQLVAASIPRGPGPIEYQSALINCPVGPLKRANAWQLKKWR